MATHRAFVGSFAQDDASQWERESGLIAVYEAAPKPIWTNDPPTHPGVWWIRRPDHPGRVVEVYSERGRLYYCWTDIDPRPVLRDPQLWWSNRAIVEPLEP